MAKEPFTVAIPDETLRDLKERLKRTRFAADFANDGWQYGTNRDYLKNLVEYWIDGYDWRRVEREINSFHHYTTRVEGIPIHFIHEPGKGPRPIPHHHEPRMALDVLRLSQGDSSARRSGGLRRRPGRRVRRRRAVAARLWIFDAVDDHRNQLLAHRGYVGRADARRAGLRRNSPRRAATGARWSPANWDTNMPNCCIGIYITMTAGAAEPAVFGGMTGPLALRAGRGRMASADDAVFRRRAADIPRFRLRKSADIAYGLNDSPAGLCSWMLEKRRAWSDCGGNVEKRLHSRRTTHHDDALLGDPDLRDLGTLLLRGDSNPWQPAHNRQPVVEAPTAAAVFLQGDYHDAAAVGRGLTTISNAGRCSSRAATLRRWKSPLSWSRISARFSVRCARRARLRID